MDVAEITSLQQELTAHWHEVIPTAEGDDLPQLVRRNHFENFSLWHEEDIARCDDLGAERVRQAKRTIDGCNQRRNDLIEKMDKWMVANLQPPTEGCSFNSETPGMMIDRLSILALKEYHMNEEVERTDASEEHTAKCAKKLAVIKQQIADLSGALSELLEQVAAGTRSFRVYYQFKMYNDTELNPQLRRAA